MTLYVFDMDGVIWNMNDPIPGAAQAIDRLRARGDRATFLTNNSSQSRQSYVEKLARFGIVTQVEDVMTSAYATAHVLAEEGAAGSSAYVVGGPGLVEELESVGIRVLTSASDGPVDRVVVGWDRALTFDKLAGAHAAITEGGAEFVATNRDPTYPCGPGRTLPGGGSIVALLVTSTGVTPRTIGKPEPHALRILLDSAGVKRQDCVVIGDRLDTDIALGRRYGTRTALVLTGVSTMADVEATPADLKPDVVWPDLSSL